MSEALTWSLIGVLVLGLFVLLASVALLHSVITSEGRHLREEVGDQIRVVGWTVEALGHKVDAVDLLVNELHDRYVPKEADPEAD